MSLKNVMVAQSGGPTVAINASLAGVIRGVMASDQYETVYGSEMCIRDRDASSSFPLTIFSSFNSLRNH